jgi:hypothetical protein
MIVKQRDAQATTIKKLEQRAACNSDSLHSRACASAAARLRADVTSARAADLIDTQFGPSEEWAVIHDLRLRIGGHAVQINHVLINNALVFVCLDTRYLDVGLHIGEHGQCRTIDRHESRAIASPINKMAKDVRMLRSHLHQQNLLPRRFHVTQRATLKGFVLTNPGLRLCVDFRHKGPDAIEAFPGDALFAKLWKQELRASRLLGACLSAQQLFAVASGLAGQHQAVFSSALLEEESLVTERTRSLLSRI